MKAEDNTPLEDLSKNALLNIIYSAYLAVGAIAYEMEWRDSEDIIRLLDILAYGKTKDGIDLLPFPRNPLRDAKEGKVMG